MSTFSDDIRAAKISQLLRLFGDSIEVSMTIFEVIFVEFYFTTNSSMEICGEEASAFLQGTGPSYRGREL